MASSFLGFLLTTRVVTSFVICLAVVLPSLSKGVGLLNSFLSSLPLVLASMGGFALNDVFDHEKDAVNEPKRAIPRGLISVDSAFGLAVILLSACFFSILFLSNTPQEFYIYLYPLIGVAAYNYIVRYMTILKNITTAFICVSPILYDVVVLNYTGVYLLLPAAVFLFILGRELLMDVKDIEGDLGSGISTIPIKFGVAVTEKIGFASQIIGIAILIPLVYYRSETVFSMIWAVLFCITVLTAVLWFVRKSQSMPGIISVMRVHMLFGVTLLVV